MRAVDGGESGRLCGNTCMVATTREVETRGEVGGTGIIVEDGVELLVTFGLGVELLIGTGTGGGDQSTCAVDINIETIASGRRTGVGAVGVFVGIIT